MFREKSGYIPGMRIQHFFLESGSVSAGKRNPDPTIIRNKKNMYIIIFINHHF